MPNPLRHLVDRLFPRVCPACEGGSGYVRDRQTRELRKCTFCGGTGNPPRGRQRPPARDRDQLGPDR